MFSEDQPARRLPVYILVDRAGAMDGEPIRALNQGFHLLRNVLEAETSAVEAVWICVISFGGDSLIEVPLTPLVSFHPPALTAGGCASFGGALRLLSEVIDEDRILRSCQRDVCHLKPMALVFTNGQPNDEWHDQARTLWHRVEENVVTIIAVGTGPGDTAVLSEITDNVILMETMSPQSILSLLDWFAGLIKVASRYRSSGQLASESASSILLPPLPIGFQVVA